MAMKRNVFLMAAICLGMGLQGNRMAAQQMADTLFLYQEQTRMEKFRSRPFYQITKSAIPLFAASALALTVDHRIKETRDFYLSDFGTTFDSYLQFVPAVTMLGMKLGGVKGRSTWAEMITADAISIATVAALVNGIKYTVKRGRPDNSRRTSFPSGHTANAFLIATMMYKEYGELSPWVGIGSYASASTVAVMRMLNNRHWMSDVLFGAGIGILSTELGYYLSDLIFKKKKNAYFSNRSIDYTEVPSFLEYSIGYSCLFPQLYYSSAGRNLHAYGGLSASLSGAHYFPSGWGVGGTATFLSAKLSNQGGTLGSTAFLVGPEYSACICPRFFWNASLHLGGGSLLLDQDVKKNGFVGRVRASLLGQLSPTMGLRLFANYTYTTLSGEPVYKDLTYLSVGIAACALF